MIKSAKYNARNLLFGNLLFIGFAVVFVVCRQFIGLSQQNVPGNSVENIQPSKVKQTNSTDVKVTSKCNCNGTLTKFADESTIQQCHLAVSGGVVRIHPHAEHTRKFPRIHCSAMGVKEMCRHCQLIATTRC